LRVLCNNAVKFTAHGEVEFRVSLRERSPDRVLVLFAVRDTGIGLAEEQAQRIFQPFIQADMSSTRRFGGTGLGLAVSQRLVAMMNGRIWLQSQEGQGSTFFVEVEFGLDADGAQLLKHGESISLKRTSLAAESHSEKTGFESGASAASILQWLKRFEQSFDKVSAGLRTLNTADNAVTVKANTNTNTKATIDLHEAAGEVFFHSHAKELIEELKCCLEENNTRAEELVTQLQAMAGDLGPVWLTAVSQAVDALDYEKALAGLRSLDMTKVSDA
jgi:hypothetical protein